MIRSVIAGLIVGLACGLAFGAEPQKPLSAVVDKGSMSCEQCMSGPACQGKCSQGVDVCQYGCSATDAACRDPCVRQFDRCTKWCNDMPSKCANCPQGKK